MPAAQPGPPRTELNSPGLNSPPGPRRRPLILHPVLQIRHARGACAGEPALRRREHGRPRADTHGRQISGAGPHNVGRPLSFCRMLMKTGCFPDNLPVEPGVFAGDFGQRDHFSIGRKKQATPRGDTSSRSVACLTARSVPRAGCGISDRTPRTSRPRAPRGCGRSARCKNTGCAPRPDACPPPPWP